MFGEAQLVYRYYHNLEKKILFQDLTSSEVECSVIPERRKTAFGEILSLKLTANENIELVDFQLEAFLEVDKDSLMMVNGFQSWSSSQEMGKNDRLEPVFSLSRFATGPYGDYDFHKYSGRRGKLHSWTYTYFRTMPDQLFLLGSIDESYGYTLFDYDFKKGKMILRRDCRGAIVYPGEDYLLLQIYIGQAREQELFQEYFGHWERYRDDAPHMMAWNSWYNYYTDISEELVDINLEALHKENIPVDVFQIDDGYQKAVGDWLEVNDKFPSGMKELAHRIRNYGHKPGLWLAPFICEQNSRLYKIHPQWLLRDEKGKPVKAGWNPLWSGTFFALDFYNKEVREYLRQVFQTVQEEWGFEFLKLDFLYAVALLPREGRSRGEIMCEAMEFLHSLAKGSQLLGCGVPLGAAIGKVDYCRIGSDVAPFWDFQILKMLNIRERISTVNSLRSTLGRYHLDGLAFRNDPDAFILGDGKPGANFNKMNFRQRYTLFFLNHLLGGLVSFSDNVTEYTEEQMNLFWSAFPLHRKKEISDINKEDNLYRIKFKIGKHEYLALVNLGDHSKHAKIDKGVYFNPEHFLKKDYESIEVMAHQTVCFRKVAARPEKPYLLGATGHIFPGAQIDKTIAREDNFILKMYPEAFSQSKVYVAVPTNEEYLRVNKVDYPVKEWDGFNYVEIKPLSNKDN